MKKDYWKSRNEEYQMTRAFLTFLSEAPVSAALEAGLSAPGFDP